jgi:hypothetical protein
MILFTIGLITAPLLLERLVRATALRKGLGLFLPVLAIITILVGCINSSGVTRLFFSSAVLLYSIKAASLLLRPYETMRSGSWLGKLYFMTIWPGLDVGPFLKSPVPQVEDQRRFAGGVTRCLVGFTCLVLVCFFARQLPGTWQGALMIVCVLLAVHLGLSDVLTEITHAIGWRVKPLFDAPWQSDSLSDFWTRRWNRPFVEMNRVFLMSSLAGKIGLRASVLVAFVVSGLLHELAISYPAKGGYGLPLFYFAIQLCGVFVERRLRIRGFFWTATVILLPLPLLFHELFTRGLVAQYVLWQGSLLEQLEWKQVLSVLLWGAGIAQFFVLLASVQVPSRLRWREELPRLSSLNHKLMWTYGSFIVLIIVSFGVLTLWLHQDILEGTRAGLALSLFIFAFWGLRLVTDAFYFKKSDWPVGPFMQIGHTMLNCLFTFIFLIYGAAIGSHLLGPRH